MVAHASSKKRLIICCDGSWQASNSAVTNVPSNVTKLSRAIAHNEKLPDGGEIQQIVYYQAGIGTSSLTQWLGFIEGAIGIGLNEHVIEAYYFLANNWEEGDEIFLFGFSRGAYTARCVAGLIETVGIIETASLHHFPTVYKAYQEKGRDEFLAYVRTEEHQWPRATGGANVKIKVVGVWDTVGNLGVPQHRLTEWFRINEKYKFHRPDLARNIEHAFQALALDEHRRPFSPTLWHLPKDQEHNTKLVQCWFPGYHVNIGGGSKASLANNNPKTDMENMADITFFWMLDLIQPHLEFDVDYVSKLISANQRYITDAPTNVTRGWAIGPIVDPFASIMKLGGSLDRRPGQYDDMNKADDLSYVAQDTNEVFHPSVRVRQHLVATPPAHGLKNFDLRAGGERNELYSGWEWAKVLPDGKKLVLSEHRIGGRPLPRGSFEELLLRNSEAAYKLVMDV